MRRIAAVMCLAAMFAGCGGVSLEESQQELDFQQSYLYACTEGSSWTRRWYSDPARTVEVGREDCDCGWLTKYGTTRGYYSQTLRYSCY